MSNSNQPENFETALHTLESLVERMESNELPLEESLKLFEQGIQLTRFCQQSLNKAELQVQALMEGNDDVAGQDIGN